MTATDSHPPQALNARTASPDERHRAPIRRERRVRPRSRGQRRRRQAPETGACRSSDRQSPRVGVEHDLATVRRPPRQRWASAQAGTGAHTSRCAARRTDQGSALAHAPAEPRAHHSDPQMLPPPATPRSRRPRQQSRSSTSVTRAKQKVALLYNDAIQPGVSTNLQQSLPRLAIGLMKPPGGQRAAALRARFRQFRG
jgi:hypothetical protein